MTMSNTKLDLSFYSLLVGCIVASLLTGSTLQWVLNNGGIGISRKTQYNLIVTVAAISSLVQTVTCYINYLMSPDFSVNFIIYILFNWIIMTHSSVMLVSNRLALTDLNPRQTWRRLLLINVIMLPFSLFICISWGNANSSDNPIWAEANVIVEPIQIALWGLIEFALSGLFVVKMWKFHWTAVEKRGIFVLAAVAICDISTVLLNLFIGDLQSTSVKGLVYCIRIRLEVSVLDGMVNFVQQRRRGSVSYGGPATSQVQGSTTARSWFHGHSRRNNNKQSSLPFRSSASGSLELSQRKEQEQNHHPHKPSTTAHDTDRAENDPANQEQHPDSPTDSLEENKSRDEESLLQTTSPNTSDDHNKKSSIPPTSVRIDHAGDLVPSTDLDGVDEEE